VADAYKFVEMVNYSIINVMMGMFKMEMAVLLAVMLNKIIFAVMERIKQNLIVCMLVVISK